jgi:CDP-4-dehydro-6-deoxyglucose reductase
MGQKIKVLPSQAEFVAETGESIVNASLNAGFSFPHGCKNGQCGGCKARLLDGEVAYVNEYQPQLLSRAEREQGLIIACMATPQSDLKLEIDEQPLKPEIPPQVYSATITEKNFLADDVLQLMLNIQAQSSEGYYAGQYLSVLLQDGQRRAFSMANRHVEGASIELHIRHCPNGLFTPELFLQKQVGDAIELEMPLGSFQVDETSQRPILFVAGSTGFAPIKCMIESLIESATHRDRYMHLFWGAENSSMLYMNKQVQNWVGERDNFHYTPVISGKQNDWSGKRGLVHKAVVDHYSDLSKVDVYVAGPPPMIAAVREVFPAYGLDLNHLFLDAFEPAVVAKAKSRNIFGRLFGR